nr:unnamed protein product [Digitaria exilis]
MPPLFAPNAHQSSTKLWRYHNYTFGLPNMSLTGMILVTLLFIPLAVILLHHLPPSPAPAPSSSPLAATAPEPSPSPAPE